MLGVSEATVKRWSDAGTLRCFRTPGGHRKFRLRDVKSFLADQETEALRAPAIAPPTTELTVEQRDARQLALAGDVDGLVSFVATHRLQGVTLSSIFDRYIGPAMNDIGEGWFQGKLSAAQEHIATAAIVDMIARVRPLLEKAVVRRAATETGVPFARAWARSATISRSAWWGSCSPQKASKPRCSAPQCRRATLP